MLEIESAGDGSVLREVHGRMLYERPRAAGFERRLVATLDDLGGVSGPLSDEELKSAVSRIAQLYEDEQAGSGPRKPLDGRWSTFIETAKRVENSEGSERLDGKIVTVQGTEHVLRTVGGVCFHSARRVAVKHAGRPRDTNADEWKSSRVSSAADLAEVSTAFDPAAFDHILGAFLGRVKPAQNAAGDWRDKFDWTA